MVSSATVSFNSLHVGFWLSTEKRRSYCMENSTGFYDSCFWPQGPYFVDTRLQYLFENPLIAPNRKPINFIWRPSQKRMAWNARTKRVPSTMVGLNKTPGFYGSSFDCVFCWLPNSHAPEACHDVTVWPLICWRGFVTPDLAQPLKNGENWLWQSEKILTVHFSLVNVLSFLKGIQILAFSKVIN